MSVSRLWTIARLELLQRVRTVSWYVLLGVFGLVLLGWAWRRQTRNKDSRD